MVLELLSQFTHRLYSSNYPGWGWGQQFEQRWWDFPLPGHMERLPEDKLSRWSIQAHPRSRTQAKHHPQLTIHPVTVWEHATPRSLKWPMKRFTQAISLRMERHVKVDLRAQRTHKSQPEPRQKLLASVQDYVRWASKGLLTNVPVEDLLAAVSCRPSPLEERSVSVVGSRLFWEPESTRNRFPDRISMTNSSFSCSPRTASECRLWRFPALQTCMG